MTIILFDSRAAAEEVAYMLRGEWDGLNAVIIENFDRSAFDLAMGLCDVKEWCFQGDYTGKNDLDATDIEKAVREKLAPFKFENSFLKTPTYQIKIDWKKYDGDDIIFPD